MTVPKGGLVAVVGRVGQGKSTMLSAILGEVQKNSGAVNVDVSLKLPQNYVLFHIASSHDYLEIKTQTSFTC